jgi:hypothetical protein
VCSSDLGRRRGRRSRWWIRRPRRKVSTNEVEKDAKYEGKEGEKKKDKHVEEK